MIVDWDANLGKFVADAPFIEIELLRRIPNRRFDKDRKIWIAGPTKTNVEYFRKTGAGLTVDAQNMMDSIKAGPKFKYGEIPGIFKFKTPPMSQQLEPLKRMVDLPAYALYMDPGTGKTKIFIDDVNIAFLNNEITASVVLCPNSVKSNWVDELLIHSSEKFDVQIYEPERKAQILKWANMPGGPCVKWLIMGIESLSQGGADVVLDTFLCLNRSVFIIDESDTIATPDSIRTGKVHKLGRLALKRRIGTGTPISKGIHNTWAQYEFLDPAILDTGYYAFKNHYCIKGGFKGKQIIGNCNEPEFIDLVAPYTFQISKAECLDLPPKIYQTRKVAPSPEMRRMYEELRKSGAVLREDDSVLLSYNNVLVRDLRLQQITGGFYTPDPQFDLEQPTGYFDIEDPECWAAEIAAKFEKKVEPTQVPGPNPKLEDMLHYIRQIRAEEKAIIWARFTPEVDMLEAALKKEYGDGTVVSFSGKTSLDDRTLARQRFQGDPATRFFVGQIQTGGIGITLTAASYELYFSNSWALRHRIQSEDRAHRVGQTKSVIYVDWLIDMPWVDSKILLTLQQGKSYTEYIMSEIREVVR